MMASAAATRVALFADTFYEVNGAARTCREWDAFARRHGLPFFCVRWGSRRALSAEACQLVRSNLAFLVDSDLRFDPVFYRVLESVQKQLAKFRPDVIHVTSPGDLGILGSILAARLKIRLALSWHTNLHEFAARRVQQMFGWIPRVLRALSARAVEQFVLDRVCWFFGRGDVLFAPNPELRSLLQTRTGKPVFLMGRGVDTELFRPERRNRTDNALVVGFVGRLMPELRDRERWRVLRTYRADRPRGVAAPRNGTGSAAAGEKSALAPRLPGRFIMPTRAPSPDPERLNVRAAAVYVLTHPWQVFITDWNWKTALLSAIFRMAIWPTTKAAAVRRVSPGAQRGLLIEFAYRLAIGGFWGCLLQAGKSGLPNRSVVE